MHKIIVSVVCISVQWWGSLQADDQWKLVGPMNLTEEPRLSGWGVEVNAFGGGNQEMQLYTDRPENS